MIRSSASTDFNGAATAARTSYYYMLEVGTS
jgi:hypothetical protein